MLHLRCKINKGDTKIDFLFLFVFFYIQKDYQKALQTSGLQETEIVIDSVFKPGENYFPQTFLEECKYKVKEKDIKSLILMMMTLKNKNKKEKNIEENSW